MVSLSWCYWNTQSNILPDSLIWCQILCRSNLKDCVFDLKSLMTDRFPLRILNDSKSGIFLWTKDLDFEVFVSSFYRGSFRSAHDFDFSLNLFQRCAKSLTAGKILWTRKSSATAVATRSMGSTAIPSEAEEAAADPSSSNSTSIKRKKPPYHKPKPNFYI